MYVCNVCNVCSSLSLYVCVIMYVYYICKCILVWCLILDILATIFRRWSKSSNVSSNWHLANSATSLLSHFAANVCPQGFPQTLTTPAVQKDKVGLLQMSKFEASKDFPQEPHHPHRTTSLFGDFKQIDMTTGRAAECTARAGISISFW